MATLYDPDGTGILCSLDFLNRDVFDRLRLDAVAAEEAMDRMGDNRLIFSEDAFTAFKDGPVHDARYLANRNARLDKQRAQKRARRITRINRK